MADKILLSKVVVMPPKANSYKFCETHFYKRKDQVLTNKMLREIKSLLEKDPKAFIEIVSKNCFNESNILEYSRSKYYNLPNFNSSLNTESVYFASSNYKLYILGQMIVEFTNLISEFKEKAHQDILDFSLKRIEMQEALNLALCVYQNEKREHLWGSSNIDIMVEPIVKPLIYYDITDSPILDNVIKLISKYLEIYGNFDGYEIEDNDLVLFNKKVNGKVRIMATDKNSELKDYGLSLAKRK